MGGIRLDGKRDSEQHSHHGWTGGLSPFIGEVTVLDKSRGGVSASNLLQLANSSISADSTGLTTLLFTRPLWSAADFATVYVNGTNRSTIVWAKGENVPRDLSDVDGHSHENHGIASFSFVSDSMIDPGSGSDSGGSPHCDHGSTGSAGLSGRFVPFRNTSRYMEACSELSFSFVLCWNFLDDGLSIQMSLQAVPTESGGYLALGFGEQMVGSPAIIGAIGANGDHLLSTYDLVSYTSGTARVGSAKLSIRDTDVSVDRHTSVVTMVFTRSLLLPLYSMGSITIDTSVVLVWAVLVWSLG